MRHEDFEFDLASLYLDAIGASDDPPEQQTAASTAIENGGSISKRSSNTEVAEDAANRNRKVVPELVLPCLPQGASAHGFS